MATDALTYFVTPNEQLSFSAVIDKAIHISGQVQSIAKVVEYANSCIREGEARGLFHESLIELAIVATDTVMSWEIPISFRKMQTVYYSAQDVYPNFVMPGKRMQGLKYMYYSAGGKIFFGGCEKGETIKLAYYVWTVPYSYYIRPTVFTTFKNAGLAVGNEALRPAYFNVYEAAWYYLQEDNTTYGLTLPTDEAMALARKKTGNWLVLKHGDAVVAGILSQFATVSGDTQKSAPYYSQYQNWLNLMQKTSEYAGEVNSQ